jgi:glutaminyl-peptide cyclotransferase
MTTTYTNRERLAAAVALLAVSVMSVVLLAVWLHASQAPQGSKVTFDGSKAYDYLRNVVAFGPRPPGSAALEQTRQYIRKELKALGIDTVEQAFDADTPLGRFHMVNLIARIPGTSPERIVFAGHYDTKLFREFRFVGANDAGSSTAFLLEWARVLKARPNKFTSELLFLDGEEALRTEWVDPDNRYGSRHYVRAAQQDGSIKQVRAMILVDMIGDRDLRIKRESESTRWLKEVIWAAAKRVKHGDTFVDEETPIEDDHYPFLEAGVPSADIIDLDYPPWHQPGDTLDKVSARSMQIVGEVLIEALPDIEKRLVKK